MRRLVVPALTATLSLALLSCTDDAPSETAPAAGQTSDLSSSNPSSSGHAELHEDFTVVEHATFDEGWAMSFLPGTDLLAVTERGGSLQLYDPDANDARAVDGVPEVYHEARLACTTSSRPRASPTTARCT